MTSASGGILITAIGSGSYWAELAVARPLLPLWATPISGPPTFEPHLNITYYVECHLHSHYNVLTSTGIENCIVCWGSFDWFTARQRGYTKKFCSRVDFPPSKSWLAPDVLLKWLFVLPAHFFDASAAYDHRVLTILGLAVDSWHLNFSYFVRFPRYMLYKWCSVILELII